MNGRIRAREVRVIVAATNEQLGVLPIHEALKKAQSLGLDLVEVAANANPPVCRIIDFGKYRYDTAKQEKERKQSAGRVKEIKFRVNIEAHDYLTKIRHGEDFLAKGNKVKVQLQFRGRENAHREMGMDVMQRVKEDLSGMSQCEMEPKLVGRAISMTLSPLPVGKRKRRFTKESEIVESEDDENASSLSDAEEEMA